MFNFGKKLLAAALTAGMMLSMATSAFAAGSPTTAAAAVTDKTGVVKTVSTNKTSGNATLKSVVKTTAKTITVPKTVTVKGVKTKITVIGAKAFKNATKVKKINLSSKTTKLNKNAFAKCSKLKTITYSGKKSLTVKDGAFKGVDTTKMTFKVTKSMSKKEYKKLKKALKAAGFEGKIKRVSSL